MKFHFLSQLHRTLLYYLIALQILSVTSVNAADPSGKVVRVVNGDDWWLPESVQPTPGTGFGWIDSEFVRKWTLRYPVPKSEDIYFSQFIFVNWAEVNPEPGVFRWDSIDRQVEAISQTPGLGFALWPAIYARSLKKLSWSGLDFFFGKLEGPAMTPRWLEAEGVSFLPRGTPVFWDSKGAYLNALEPFIAALGERYRNHPRFAWVEMRCCDYIAGEGLFRELNETRETIATAITPTAMETSMKRMIEIFAEAFRGKERAIVLTNWEPTYIRSGPAFSAATERIWQYAISKGFGGRDGQIEVWNRYLTSGYGISVDRDGYLDLNEDFPPIRENRIWHSENENYLEGGNANFGPPELGEYRWFASSMRLLQMRRNWITIYGGAALKWPTLSRYVQLSLGKTSLTSPDALCWLREGYPGKQPIKNFERWLMQRDIGPDGHSLPAAQVDISEMNQLGARGYEYEARQTNQKAGQDALYFQVSQPWFGAGPRELRLFVQFQNGNRGAWFVEYDTIGGRVRSPEVKASGQTGWSTAVLDLPGLQASGRFPENMDFRLIRAEGDDLVVRLIRMVKIGDR